MTPEEKQRVEQLISRLEMSVGELFSRDSRLAPTVSSMLQDLGGLRTVLGMIKRRAGTPDRAETT
jgi:hypothetical protein